MVVGILHSLHNSAAYLHRADSQSLCVLAFVCVRVCTCTHFFFADIVAEEMDLDSNTCLRIVYSHTRTHAHAHTHTQEHALDSTEGVYNVAKLTTASQRGTFCWRMGGLIRCGTQ